MLCRGVGKAVGDELCVTARGGGDGEGLGEALTGREGEGLREDEAVADADGCDGLDGGEGGWENAFGGGECCEGGRGEGVEDQLGRRVGSATEGIEEPL